MSVSWICYNSINIVTFKRSKPTQHFTMSLSAWLQGEASGYHGNRETLGGNSTLTKSSRPMSAYWPFPWTFNRISRSSSAGRVCSVVKESKYERSNIQQNHSVCLQHVWLFKNPELFYGVLCTLVITGIKPKLIMIIGRSSSSVHIVFYT